MLTTTADVTAHLTRLSSCLSVLHNWFCHNGLALNSSKSESILFGTRQRLRNFPSVSTPTIAGSQIPFSDNIKTLGVTLDANLTLNQHVSSLCKSMHFHTRALRHICPALSDCMATTLATSLVQSCLDYANSLLHGTSAANIHKLQCVSCHHCKHLSARMRLSNLHWLPVVCPTRQRQSYMSFSKNHYWTLKFKMAEIRHLENRHDVIFLPWGSNLNKIWHIRAEWYAYCSDMVDIETGSRIPVCRMFVFTNRK